jgi:hypothetical protein
MFEIKKMKIPSTGILISITLLVYFCIRLYGYYVPEKNVKINFKKDSCGIVEAVGQAQIEDCALHGDLRIAMTGNAFFLKLKTGDEIYFSKDAMSSIEFPNNSNE